MPDLTWEYGITTVPSRADVLFPRTVASLAKAGFGRPHIFVDGCEDPSAYTGLGLECTVRSGRIRTSGHWISSLWELWCKNPNADRYAIFQDDFVISLNAKEYLESCKWPGPGYLNLLTFRENHKLIGNKSVGWHRSDQLGKGAVALVFDSESVRALLSNPHLVAWIRDKTKGHRLIDRAVSQTMNKAKVTEYIHNPSLIQHTGLHSSMGSDRHPLSTCFRGEDWDATQFKSEYSKADSARGRPIIRVAIPAVDSLDLTLQCLKSLSKSDWPLIVDYIDNGSRRGTMQSVKSAADSLGVSMECTRFEENMGFTAAVNVSMKKAIENGQHCMILNNDCFVGSKTIRRLYQAMVKDPSIAAVGPFSMDSGSQSLRRPARLKQSGLSRIPTEPSDADSIQERLRINKSIPIKRLAFFCSLLSCDAMQSLGVLSSDLPDGLGADDLWCHFARKNGMTCNLVLDAYAHHMHSETFKRLGLNRRKMSKVAVRKLRKYN